MDEKVSFGIGFDTTQAVTGAKAFAEALKQILGVSSELKEMGPVGEGLAKGKELIAELAVEMGALLGVSLSVGAAVEGIVKGLEKADVLRDLHASIEALSGSAASGEAAFKRLDKAAEETRATGDKLVEVYGHLLPLAIDRGFSQEGAQKFVAQLAKAAPAIGETLDQVMQQAEQILAGRVRKTNLLAHVLGLDPQSYTQGLQQLDSVFPKLDELAEKGEKIGLTWEAAGEKIKDSLLHSFADGFNQARSGVDSALNDIVKKFQDPQLTDALKDFGKAFADIAPAIIDAGTKFAQFAASVIDSIRQMRAASKAQDGGTIAGIMGDWFWNPNIADRGQQAATDLNRLVQYQRLQRAGSTGALGAGQFGPAVPGLYDWVRNTPDQAAIDRLAKWSSTMADSGEKTKSVRDAMEQFVGTLQAAKSAVAEAGVGFDHLFSPKETDPLLRQIQELQTQAEAFGQKLENEREKLLAEAAKSQTPPAVAAQLRAAADAIANFVEQLGTAETAAEDFAKKDALRASLEKLDEQIRKVDDSFDAFAENLVRKFTGPEGTTGVGQALSDMLSNLKQQMDAELAQARQQDVLGIWALTPELEQQIKSKYESLGKDLVATTSKVVQQADQQFSAMVQQIFATAMPGIGGVTDMTAVESQIQQVAMMFAEQIQAHSPFPITLSQALDQIQPKLNQAFVEAANKSVEALQAAFSNLSGGLTDLFVGAMQDGAKGFANSAASLFSKQLQKNVGDIMNQLVTGVFGGVQAVPQGASAEQAAAITAANQRTTQLANGTLDLIALFSQLASAGSGVNNPRQQPVGTVLGTTLTGLSAGATIGGATAIGGTYGGIIGAIVGLIVGGLMLALAPAVGKAYPYAQFGVSGTGGAYFNPTQNITPNEQQDALSRLQNAYNSLWNGWVKVMIDLPITNLHQQLARLGGLTPTIGLDQPSGDIGHAASQQFWQDFSNYIQAGMPQDMAAKFFDPISKGFQQLGLSAEAFGQIWEQLKNVNPQNVTQDLDNLALGLKEIGEASKFFSGTQRDLLTAGYTAAHQTFLEQLRDTDQQITDFASNMDLLVGEDRINAMKQLGDMEAQRQQQEVEFLKAIQQGIENVTQSYQSAIRGLQLEGLKTPGGKADIQAQVNFLKGYADQLVNQIKGSTSPEQVLQLSQELQNTIMQIKQLGGSVSPQANEAFRQWAIKNLQAGQDLVTQKLQSFAKQLEDQNKRFTDAIDKFIKAFETATDAITGHSTIPPPPPPPGSGGASPYGPGYFNNELPRGGHPSGGIRWIGGDVPENWVDWWATQPWKGNSQIPDWPFLGPRFPPPSNNPPRLPIGGNAVVDEKSAAAIQSLADAVRDGFVIANHLVIEDAGSGAQVSYDDRYVARVVRGRYAT